MRPPRLSRTQGSGGAGKTTVLFASLLAACGCAEPPAYRLERPVTIESMAARGSGPVHNALQRMVSGQPLSLADCRAIALAHNHDLAAARGGANLARIAHDAAKALLRPTLSANAGYSFQTPEPPSFTTSVVVPVGPGPPFTSFNIQTFSAATGEEDRFDLRAVLAYTLYDFGKNRALVHAAAADADAGARAMEEIQRSVEFRVDEAYFRRYQAEAQRVVIEQSLPALEKALADQEKLEAQGLSVRSDTMLLEVTLARRRQDLRKTADAVRRSQWRLNQVMGVPVTTPLKLELPPPPPPVTARDTATLDAETCVRVALEIHPALRRLGAQRAAMELREKSARREYLPSLGLSATYDLTSSESAFREEETLTGAINLQWNLYSGGARAAKVRETRERMRMNRNEAQKMLAQIDANVRNARLTLDQIQGDRVIALKAVEQAALELDQERKRRAAGRSTQRDVLNAEARLIRERFGQVSADYSFQIGRAGLALAIGVSLSELLDPNFGITPTPPPAAAPQPLPAPQ